MSIELKMPAPKESPGACECGVEYRWQLKWNDGDPKWFAFSQCSCKDDAIEAEARSK